MSAKEYKISEETLSKLENVSLAQLINWFSKYPVVTRKLLLIRPLRKGHSEEIAMNTIANAMAVEANSKNWDVIDLKGNNASPSNILNKINTENPDFVVYYGHSLSSYSQTPPILSAIPGQIKQNNVEKLQFAITPANANVLSNRTASITACSTAKKGRVGEAAVNAKCIAYLGYDCPFTLWWGGGAAQDYADATNAANLALLSGERYEEARQIAKNKWYAISTYWNNERKSNPKISPLMTADMLAMGNGLTLLGNPKAVARPIGILVTP